MNILSTTDYDKFILRDDNRASICRSKVASLKRSIQKRNLLHIFPILVNEKMEIFNGQHRYLAAKDLGVPIYYVCEKDLLSHDILTANAARAWTLDDYLNFFVKNHYPEYMKMKKYMDEHGLKIRAMLAICGCGRAVLHKSFKEGDFIFDEKECELATEIGSEIVSLVKNGSKDGSFIQSMRFWFALLRLINHPEFDREVWKRNLALLSNRLKNRSTTDELTEMLFDIYNYKQRRHIHWDKETESL